MPASSLREMAIRSCIRNLVSIKDVADMSYDAVEPVLRAIGMPQQLRDIEKNSPQIADRDAPLWLAFIKRDIPDWKEKIFEPPNEQSWWKVYRKLIRDERKLKEEQEQDLRRAMAGLSQKRAEEQTTYVQAIIPRPTKQTAFVDGVRNPNVNAWNNPRPPPALSKATKGKDIIAAIRKQCATEKRQKGLGRPADLPRYVPSAKSQITQAPKSMVKDAQTPKKPEPENLLRPWESIPVVRMAADPKVVRVFATKKEPTREELLLNKALKAEQARKEDIERQRASLRRKTAVSTNSISSSGASRVAANAASPPTTSVSNARRLIPGATQPPKNTGQSSADVHSRKLTTAGASTKSPSAPSAAQTTAKAGSSAVDRSSEREIDAAQRSATEKTSLRAIAQPPASVPAPSVPANSMLAATPPRPAKRRGEVSVFMPQRKRKL